MDRTHAGEMAAQVLTALDHGEPDRARAILEGFAVPVETRPEYRNEDGESTFDEAEADGWTDAGIDGPHAEAIADAMRKAAGADREPLATKAELRALRVELRIIGALVFAIAAKLFGIFNAVAGVLS